MTLGHLLTSFHRELSASFLASTSDLSIHLLALWNVFQPLPSGAKSQAPNPVITQTTTHLSLTKRSFNDPMQLLIHSTLLTDGPTNHQRLQYTKCFQSFHHSSIAVTLPAALLSPWTIRRLTFCPPCFSSSSSTLLCLSLCLRSLCLRSSGHSTTLRRPTLPDRMNTSHIFYSSSSCHMPWCSVSSLGLLSRSPPPHIFRCPRTSTMLKLTARFTSFVLGVYSFQVVPPLFAGRYILPEHSTYRDCALLDLGLYSDYHRRIS
jgi:hypothetical protein